MNLSAALFSLFSTHDCTFFSVCACLKDGFRAFASLSLLFRCETFFNLAPFSLSSQCINELFIVKLLPLEEKKTKNKCWLDGYMPKNHPFCPLGEGQESRLQESLVRTSTTGIQHLSFQTQKNLDFWCEKTQSIEYMLKF